MILKHFHFWCQKVLPLVYDDSLSYYEVLCKVTRYINELIDQDKVFAAEIADLQREVQIIEDLISNLDIETLQRIVDDALAMLSGVLYTSIIPENEDAASSINRAISNGVRFIYVDSDITLTAPIELAAGTQMTGMGGTITINDLGGYGIVSRGSEKVVTTVTNEVTSGATQINVTSAAGIQVGKRYKIVGTQNLYDPSVGLENWLARGTSPGANTVYGNVEFVCVGVSNGTVLMDRVVPFYIGNAALIYEAEDVENVRLDSLTIIGVKSLVGFYYANSCTITNCSLVSTNGYHPAALVDCYDCTVENCVISAGRPGSANYQYNELLLSTCGDCHIVNNTLSGGSQNIDITTHQRISYRNLVSGNTISGGIDDSITTHPGCVYNVFDHNICSGNISLRSVGNVISNNLVMGYVSVGDARCNNTVIKENTVYGSPTAFRVSYWSDREIVDQVSIMNNACPNANHLIQGTVYSIRLPGDTETHFSLRLIASGNIMSGSGTGYAFYLTGYDSLRSDPWTPISDTPIPAPMQSIVFENNTMIGFITFGIFRRTGNSMSPETNIFVLKDNTFIVDSLYFYNVEDKITGRPIVSGNNKGFRDALPAGSSNGMYGAAFPSDGSIGEVYVTTEGAVGIWNGSQWVTIS